MVGWAKKGVDLLETHEKGHLSSTPSLRAQWMRSWCHICLLQLLTSSFKALFALFKPSAPTPNTTQPNPTRKLNPYGFPFPISLLSPLLTSSIFSFPINGCSLRPSQRAQHHCYAPCHSRSGRLWDRQASAESEEACFWWQWSQKLPP